jgi:phage portal protein BeeE
MMNWLRPRAPEAKASRAGAVMALTGTGRPRWTPRDYAHLAAEGFG